MHPAEDLLQVLEGKLGPPGKDPAQVPWVGQRYIGDRVLRQAGAVLRCLRMLDLAGTWSDEEAAELEAALNQQRRIDPEHWD